MRSMFRGVSILALMAASAPAMAADNAGQPAATSDTGTTDIIVTAQRRDEKLRDVPISMTALSADALQKLHADNIGRLEFATPGFTWGSQGSDSFPAIRGVRTSLVSAQNDPVIGFYIDGIYQSRTQQQSIPLFDVARVEVLRGPQGTLYGRNTFGGNISVVTQDPTKDPGVDINLDRHDDPVDDVKRNLFEQVARIFFSAPPGFFLTRHALFSHSLLIPKDPKERM